MCAVASLLGQPAPESGRLCRGDRAEGRGDRRRRGLVLRILLVLPILYLPTRSGQRDAHKRIRAHCRTEVCQR
jgi:hypothetical protein